MKTYNARAFIAGLNKKFATTSGGYQLIFEPHLLGSMVHSSAKLNDKFCGSWLLADAPEFAVLALATAAKKLPKSMGRTFISSSRMMRRGWAKQIAKQSSKK